MAADEGHAHSSASANSGADASKIQLKGRRFLFPGGLDALPPDLHFLTKDDAVPGDSGSPQDEPPPWYDADLFLEGQRFALDNFAGLAQSDLLSLFLVFSHPPGLDPLIGTSKSDSPAAAGRRYMSTNLRLLSWYSSDPFDPGSAAHRDLVAVRRTHARIRSTFNHGLPEDLAVKFTIGKGQPRELLCPQAGLLQRAFSELPPGAYTGPCPINSSPDWRAWQQAYLQKADPPQQNGVLCCTNGVPRNVNGTSNGSLGSSNGVLNVPRSTLETSSSQDSATVPAIVLVEVDRYRRRFVTQAEMALTQWGFFGLFICKPHVFASPRVSRRELEALVHVWAVLAYCLGIDDSFNLGLGGLDAVMRRSEIILRMFFVPNLRALGSDPHGLAIWEHMSRCVVDGMHLYLHMPSFEACMAYLTEDVLALDDVHALRKARTWRQTFELWQLRFFLIYLPRWWTSWTSILSRAMRRKLVAKGKTLKAE